MKCWQYHLSFDEYMILMSIRWPTWATCMPKSDQNYWVLVMCAFSQLFKRSAFFLYRVLSSYGSNRLTGTIPAQISVLVKLQYLWALTSFLISVGQSLLHFSFSQCWPCAPLSHIFFKRFVFFLQGSCGQPIGWDNPSSNICPGQANIAVSLHFFFI